MRPATRSFLSLAAALALVVSTAAAAAAAPQPATGASLVGAETMGIFHGAKGSHGKPKPSGNKNLSFGGGSVQTAPKVYISFWGTEWSDTFSTGGYSSAVAQTYIEGFFGNVGGSPWNNVVTQYCQGVTVGTQSCGANADVIVNGSNQLGGTWNDPASVPNHPSQSQIAAAAQRLADRFQTSDPNATFMVLTPSGKSMRGFATRWCAWHSSTTYNGKNLAYAYIPYMPDAGTSCGMNSVNSTNNSYGNGYFDGFSIVAGHEYSEAETDPFPSSGWVDSSGAENADKCAWRGMENITLGSNFYAVQPTWSNASSGCAMSY